MNPTYVRLEATAKRLINAFGKDAEIRRAGAPTGPPHDPQPGADVVIACKLVETGYSLTDRDATLVLKGDKLGLISTAIGSPPEKTDRIEIEGAVYYFVDLEPLNPGGLVMLYEFLARR